MFCYNLILFHRQITMIIRHITSRYKLFGQRVTVFNPSAQTTHCIFTGRNVGKSTLFNCLSNAKAQAANFPFCTIEPNVGVITVPDERLNKLAELVHPNRIVPTTVEIVDIAGLVIHQKTH